MPAPHSLGSWWLSLLKDGLAIQEPVLASARWREAISGAPARSASVLPSLRIQ